MNFKKLFFLFFSFFSVLTANAYDCEINGIFYNLNITKKTAHVTYKIQYEPAPYTGKVSIPQSIAYEGSVFAVTSIGKEAFKDCTSLTSITLPNSVTFIEADAFLSCLSLTSITIPNSVTSIGTHAFSNCSSLTSITIPNSVTSIGQGAFSNCSSLISITIPNSVTSLGSYAFLDCSSLTSITLSNSLPHIGVGTFSGCKALKSLKLPKSVTSIGEAAITECSSLKSITIENHITNWGPWIIKNSPNLKQIEIKSKKFNFKILSTILNQLQEISIPVDFLGEIPSQYVRLIKKKMPAASIEEYTNDYPFMSWEEYKFKYCPQSIPQTTEEITSIISNDIEKWQKKGEFESTDTWSKRVNEKTRASRIDSLKNQYAAQLKKQQPMLEKLYSDYQKDYKRHYESLCNEYISMLTKLKTDDFKTEKFELNAPYDADNQSFLIETSSYGDILLPVPISEAPSFKENWNTIKGDITPTFVFNGKDAILSKLTFSNQYKKYIYDSHTEAKYAVADINYNFEPLQFEATDFDIEDFNISVSEPNQPTIAQTVEKNSDKSSGLEKKKAEIDRTSITVGNTKTKSDVDVSIPNGNNKADKTFALIIANENYRREGRVPYALNDGKIFAEYLKSSLGLPEKNIQLFTDASLNDIKFGINKLSQICDAFGNEASVIVYYAGHGIPDEKTGSAHLLPVDGYGSDPSTGYSLKELYETLGSLCSKHTILFLDACFSGAQRNGNMMASNARGVRLKPKSSEAKGNLIVMSATQGDETAYPYEEKHHGMFTYFLLKKLNENKGEVSLGDLADYITSNVKQTSIVMNDKLQTPTITVSPALSSSWQSIQLGN